MSADHELLELAAKAVGFKLAQGYGQPPEKCLFYCDDDGCHDWNPLDDDGDAFGLMVDLRLIVTQYSGGVTAYQFGPVLAYIGYDKHPGRRAAVRRAIVCAAAEIGRRMEEVGAA